MSNPLTTANSHKYVVFADHTHPAIVQLCEQQEAGIWLSGDINFTHDNLDFQNKLSVSEQDYLKQILAFFAASDGIVGENLALNFVQQSQIPEVRYFYYFQMMMEAVHAKVYSQMINTFIPSKEERDNLFDSINKHPIIKKKADWCLKWMDSSQKTGENSNSQLFRQLVAFLAVEGIFFAGSFAAIFWLRDRGILANSLGVANEYISRDETLHAEFACTLVREFGGEEISKSEISEILVSALEIEKEFTRHALPDRLFGMNQELMIQYLEFVCDTWLHELGCQRVYNVEQPFPFMMTIGQKRKDLFFEKTRTNYARPTSNQELDFDAI